MQSDSRVRVQPGPEAGVFVGRVVVADDAQAYARMGLGDGFEEGEELDVGDEGEA